MIRKKHTFLASNITYIGVVDRSPPTHLFEKLQSTADIVYIYFLIFSPLCTIHNCHFLLSIVYKSKILHYALNIITLIIK